VGLRVAIIQFISNMSRFFLFLLVIFTGFTSLAGAEDNVYLVENVITDVSSKTPAEARNSGIATARRDAFLILLTRLELDLSTADNITSDEVSDMVKSEQINNEKIAGNRYYAVFSIEFSPDFVNHILKKKNPKAPTSQGDTILLIPGKMDGGHIILWEEDNEWKKVLEKLASNYNKKFIIPTSDAENIASINPDNISQADSRSLTTLMSRYNSKTAFIAIFNYDSIENKVSIDVTEIRKLQKKQSKLNFVNVNMLSYNDLTLKVAQKTLDHLSKLQNIDYSNQSSSLIHIEIISDRLNNWITIKNKIESSNLITQLNIESISQDRIKISLNYVNSEIGIIETFQKMGIPLQQTGENSYTIFLKS
jgi:hypothetical protein